MDAERLRQLVEAEVRKAIGLEAGSPAASNHVGDLLVLFTGTSLGLDTALSELQALLQLGYRTTAVLCPLAEQFIGDRLRELPVEIVSGEPIVKVEALVEASDAILILTLSRTAAAKLALGIADNFVLSLAMQALMVGKPVIAARNAADPDVVDDVTTATAKTPEPLLQLARDYLRTLESFGMQLIDASEFSQRLNPETTAQYTPSGRGKTLVSASVIAELSPQVRELIIPNPAIITPLARDLAREKGISLRIEKR